MTFEQLQCFIAAVEENTFFDAAESLHISQSSLSKQIMKLEQELETPLWDRRGRKACLTQAGRIFYEDACMLQKQYSEARNRLRQYRRESQLSLSIGTLPILSQYHLTPVFRHFQESCPQVRLALHEVEEHELMEGFGQGIYDFVIAREGMMDGKRHHVQMIARDRLTAVLPARHPLAGQNTVCLADLKNEDFIFMNPYTSICRLCLDECAKAGFSPRILRTARVETILSAVAVGEGISLLAGDSVNIFNPDHVVLMPLEPEIPLNVVLVRQRDKTATQAMKLFLQQGMGGPETFL